MLRRWEGGAGEHRVSLAAMMDLVREEVHENVGRSFRVVAVRTRKGDDTFQACVARR
jgi:hypothetical protein